MITIHLWACFQFISTAVHYSYVEVVNQAAFYVGGLLYNLLEPHRTKIVRENIVFLMENIHIKIAAHYNIYTEASTYN